MNSSEAERQHRRAVNSDLLEKMSAQGGWESFFLDCFSGNASLCEAILKKKRVPDPTGGPYKFRVYSDFASSGRAVLNPATHINSAPQLFCWLETGGSDGPYSAELYGKFFSALRRHLGVEDNWRPQREELAEISKKAKLEMEKKELAAQRLADFNRQSASLIWNNALSREDSEFFIRGYLSARGHDYDRVRIPVCWKYNPQVPYFAKVFDLRKNSEECNRQIGFFGCLIALYRDHEGAPSQMHRTFVRPINAGRNYVEIQESIRIAPGSTSEYIQRLAEASRQDRVEFGKLAEEDAKAAIKSPNPKIQGQNFMDLISGRYKLVTDDVDWTRKQIGWASPISSGILIHQGGSKEARPTVEIVGEGIETMVAVLCALPEWALDRVIIKALGNTGVLSLYTPRFGTTTVIGVQDYDLKGGGQQIMSKKLNEWAVQRQVNTILIDPSMTRENDGVPLILNKKGTDFEDLYLRGPAGAAERLILSALNSAGLGELAPKEETLNLYHDDLPSVSNVDMINDN